MATKKPDAKKDPMPEPAPMGEQVIGESIDLDGVDGPSGMLPDLPPNAPFYIAFHPNRWHVRHGLLIPMIKMLACVIGLEGASQSGKNVKMALPKARAAEQAYTVVPTSQGPGGNSYLQAVAVKGGKHHCTVWDTARAGENATEFDRQAFHDWVWKEVSAGRLPGPSHTGLRRERESVRTQHMKALARAKMSPEAEAQAELTGAALKVIDAALAKLKKAAPAVKPVGSVDLDE